MDDSQDIALGKRSRQCFAPEGESPVVKKSALVEQLASCCTSQCEHESIGQVNESEVCPLYFGDPLI